MADNGWIGVDLDGTLAVYEGWQGADHIGEPVPAMLERVKAWMREGKDVRIFTARIWHDGTSRRVCDSMAAKQAIQLWCEKHLGRALPSTCVKDYGMVELWDDRAVQIIPNTGKRADSLAD